MRNYAIEYSADRYIDNLYHSYEKERIRRTRPRPKRQNREVAKKKSADLSVNEFRALFTGIVTIGIIFISIISLNAYATFTQFNINNLKKENTTLENDIQVLELKISNNTSTEKLETYSMKNLEMIYPNESQKIHLNNEMKIPDNFAEQIRYKAYEN